MKIPSAAISASLLLSSLGSLPAQTVFVDWDQTWDYLHPNRGALPAGAGTTTPHPDGGTPWFAEQATFDASYAGPSFATSGPGFEAGSGAGPLSYGAIDYTTAPDPAPAEFTAVGTNLSTPISGQRNSAYFRTTFTVPDDGKTYDAPVIRYILDDGGFVYLDGVLVLEVNMLAGTPDDFLATAAGTANTESHIRRAELNLAPGSLTGGNDEVAAPIAGNATVVEQITELAPGEHTLAISVHNANNTSSDLTLAVQLQAGLPACFLDATVSSVSVNTNGTPNDPGDDTVDLIIKVVPSGIFGATWAVTEPAGSAAAGQGGAYNSDITVSNIPFTEFGPGVLSLILADVDDPSCTARVSVFAPRNIAADVRTGIPVPIGTTGLLPAGWIFDDGARTMTMNNGGGGARQIVRSAPLDISGSRGVQFTGVLEINDTSSGNEADDSLVAYLIIDGNTANPINLITAYDTQLVDGVLSDNEMAPAPGNYVYELSYLVPSGAKTVQIVIEGINNSNSETIIVRDLLFSKPPGGDGPSFFDVERSGNNLVFSWESQGGKLYNLRSDTQPSDAVDPIDWAIFGANSDIEATPPLNTLTIPRPADPERYFVIESFPAPPSSVFADDFESGQGGWTVGSDNAAGTAWELGAPDPGLLGGPAAANSGTNCFGTNLASEYDLNADVWLRTPPIDLTTAGGATLNYFQFYDLELIYDYATVSILDAADNSLIAELVAPFDGSTTGNWESVTRAIPAPALGKVIKIEFRLVSDEIGNFPGFYIDDVLLTVP